MVIPLFNARFFLGSGADRVVAAAAGHLTNTSPGLFQRYFAERLFGFAV
jgi:hypothetical protein